MVLTIAKYRQYVVKYGDAETVARKWPRCVDSGMVAL
jgi:hypothetical protein